MKTPESLLLQAEKMLQSKGFLSFLSGGPNYDDAADLLYQASNAFKLEKRWEQSSKTFLHASNVYTKAGDQIRSINCLMEAGHAAKKYSMKDAIDAYVSASQAYLKNGRFSQAARTQKTIAELYESDQDFRDAAKFYKLAADHFETDEFGTSSYTTCILKYADLTARLDNLDEAVHIYETEAAKAYKNSLIQSFGKEYLLKAGLIRLSHEDLDDVRIVFDQYQELDHNFVSSREGKLLNSLLGAIQNDDAAAFSAAVLEFERIAKLDTIKFHFLCECRERIIGRTIDSDEPYNGGGKAELLASDDLT